MDLARLSFLAASFCCFFPGLRPLYHNFKKNLLKAHRLRNQLQFLKDCKAEMVIPESCLPRRLRQLDDSPFPEIERTVLSVIIKRKSVEVKQAFKDSANSRTALFHSTTNNWWRTLCDYVYGLLRRQNEQQKANLKTKLDNLFEKSVWSKKSNPRLFENHSSYRLTKYEKLVLGFGLNFSFSDDRVNMVSVNKGLINLEKTSGNVVSNNIQIARGCIYSLCSNSVISNIPKCFKIALKKLKNNNDIHITKADKSNSIVILDKLAYNEKLDDLLNDEDTYEQLTSDPTANKNRKFNAKVKNLLKSKPMLLKSFSVVNPTLPYMYGLLKTHKPDKPLRPIISSVGSVSYKLSKWLTKLLSPLVGQISSSNVSNSVDLIDKIRDHHEPCKLISFDVNSLFTKVPVQDVLSFINNDLHKLDLPVSNDVFLKLIELCVLDSVFSAQGKFYRQTFGFAMGNPLSPVLSNLYMEYFETLYLPRICQFNLPWFRYIDDILCLWPSTEDPHSFLRQLNSLVPSITFKIEEENESKLPFLDTLIINNGNGFKFKVYRKPTSVDSYIHFYSNHHKKVQESTFSGMYLRALRICDPEFLDEECDYIHKLIDKLCYPKGFADNCLQKAEKTFYNVDNKELYDKKNTLVLPFHKELTPSIRILKNLDIKVVFRYEQTVKSSLIKNSPQSNTGSVYSIPCKACTNLYIGQTGKTLFERIKQHKYSVRTAQESSGIFMHVAEKNHNIDWDKATEVYKSNCATERLIVESVLIRSNSTMNLNEGLYRIDNILFKLFLGDGRIKKANRLCGDEGN